MPWTCHGPRAMPAPGGSVSHLLWLLWMRALLHTHVFRVCGAWRQGAGMSILHRKQLQMNKGNTSNLQINHRVNTLQFWRPLREDKFGNPALQQGRSK